MNDSPKPKPHRKRKSRGPYAKRRRHITIIAKQREFDEQRWITLLMAAAEKLAQENRIKQASEAKPRDHL